MNRRQRLLSALQRQPVDRPPLCFYELNGLDENPQDDNPFNIYSHPSWKPLIELTREKTDRIVMRKINFIDTAPAPIDELTKIEKHYDQNGRLHEITTIKLPSRTLTKRIRIDPDVNTIWTTEHLLKDIGDLKAYLAISPGKLIGKPNIKPVLQAEKKLQNTGIVMIDTKDPLCSAAELFDMAMFTIIAMTEQKLFHKLLEHFAALLYEETKAVAQALPNRLWRIYGPEYASPPYLPPQFFKEYVVRYDTPMINTIKKSGGFARIHSHGKLKDILDHIVETDCSAIDPIEPPPQGDVELQYVRKNYGDQLILFGNIEITDIENMPTSDFEKKVITALKQGPGPDRTGFVLMPSACPYGRVLSTLAVKNYEKMVELTENF